jgi:hypothetical protein
VHRFHNPPEEGLEWLCDDSDASPLPRHFVEVLHFSTWAEVESYVFTKSKKMGQGVGARVDQPFQTFHVEGRWVCR